jgi:hypothetical protein
MLDGTVRKTALSIEDPHNPSQCLKPNTRHALLTAEQAVHIYQLKFVTARSRSQGARAAAVGQSFGVSEKAVRDIWSGRTWQDKTKHIDAEHMPEEKHEIPLSGQGGDMALNQSAVSASVSSVGPGRNKSSTAPITRSFHILQHICGDDACEGSSSNCPTPSALASPVKLKMSQAPAALPWDSASCPETAEPLPPQSRADDPFHDDWPHWGRS